jgi:hypothetical protein
MSVRGNALSRNPNMCASCSSLCDGMDDDVSAIAEEALRGDKLTQPDKPTELSSHAVGSKTS